MRWWSVCDIVVRALNRRKYSLLSWEDCFKGQWRHFLSCSSANKTPLMTTDTGWVIRQNEPITQATASWVQNQNTDNRTSRLPVERPSPIPKTSGQLKSEIERCWKHCRLDDETMRWWDVFMLISQLRKLSWFVRTTVRSFWRGRVTIVGLQPTVLYVLCSMMMYSFSSGVFIFLFQRFSESCLPPIDALIYTGSAKYGHFVFCHEINKLTIFKYRRMSSFLWNLSKNSHD